MHPANFEYQRVTSVDEAIKLLASNDGAKALAGGHSLIPAMNLRVAQPDMLVDIGRLAALKGIQSNDGKLSVGALSTHAEVAASDVVRAHCPAMASAASQIGDQMVRNRGTIGGNLAHADPASDMPTVAVATGATIHTMGTGGARAIVATDFFLDTFTTALLPGELITRIEVDSHAGHKTAYAKFKHPASGYAVVGVCVVLAVSGKQCTGASVAVGGATSMAVKCAQAEAALVNTALDEAALEKAGNALIEDIRAYVVGDIFAPDAYRLSVAKAYLKRAVREAIMS